MPRDLGHPVPFATLHLNHLPKDGRRSEVSKYGYTGRTQVSSNKKVAKGLKGVPQKNSQRGLNVNNNGHIREFPEKI